jgi:hypothetical protein
MVLPVPGSFLYILPLCKAFAWLNEMERDKKTVTNRTSVADTDPADSYLFGPPDPHPNPHPDPDRALDPFII